MYVLSVSLPTRANQFDFKKKYHKDFSKEPKMSTSFGRGQLAMQIGSFVYILTFNKQFLNLVKKYF